MAWSLLAPAWWHRFRFATDDANAYDRQLVRPRQAVLHASATVALAMISLKAVATLPLPLLWKATVVQGTEVVALVVFDDAGGSGVRDTRGRRPTPVSTCTLASHRHCMHAPDCEDGTCVSRARVPSNVQTVTAAATHGGAVSTLASSSGTWWACLATSCSGAHRLVCSR